MLEGCWDISEDDIEEVKDQKDYPAWRATEFIDDKRFYVASKTVEDEHIDQQVRPVCMNKPRS